MSSIDNEIAEVHKIIEESQKQLAKLHSLRLKCPDIERNVDRWKRVRYYSKSVNNIVTDCDIYHGCGCCNDSPLKLSAFIKTEFGNVYADPCMVIIGEACVMGGDNEDENWENELLSHNFPQVIIDKAKKYFKDNLSYYKMKEILDGGDENE